MILEKLAWTPKEIVRDKWFLRCHLLQYLINEFPPYVKIYVYKYVTEEDTLQNTIFEKKTFSKQSNVPFPKTTDLPYRPIAIWHLPMHISFQSTRGKNIILWKSTTNIKCKCKIHCLRSYTISAALPKLKNIEDIPLHHTVNYCFTV